MKTVALLFPTHVTVTKDKVLQGVFPNDQITVRVGGETDLSVTIVPIQTLADRLDSAFEEEFGARVPEPVLQALKSLRGEMN